MFRSSRVWVLMVVASGLTVFCVAGCGKEEQVTAAPTLAPGANPMQCVVCRRRSDPAFVKMHEGEIYRFCTPQHQSAFEANPDKYIAAAKKRAGGAK